MPAFWPGPAGPWMWRGGDGPAQAARGSRCQCSSWLRCGRSALRPRPRRRTWPRRHFLLGLPAWRRSSSHFGSVAGAAPAAAPAPAHAARAGAKRSVRAHGWAACRAPPPAPRDWTPRSGRRDRTLALGHARPRRAPGTPAGTCAPAWSSTSSAPAGGLRGLLAVAQRLVAAAVGIARVVVAAPAGPGADARVRAHGSQSRTQRRPRLQAAPPPRCRT